MPLFLGYDPGGEGNHGVAAVEVTANCSIESEPETRALCDAGAVCQWVDERHDDAEGFCIDTLLAWSHKGGRACDDALRGHYPKRKYDVGVIPQNGLMGAMAINGILVARLARRRRLPLFESHPKLVLDAWLKEREADTDFARWHGKLPKKPNDHEADAFVAAWCASQWFFKEWQVDLYRSFDEELVFPAGKAIYPWPEPVPPCKPGR